MFIKADIVNGMINTMIVETMVFLFAVSLIYKLFNLDKTQKIKIAFICALKFLVYNPLATYLRNTGYDKEPYIYWITLANVVVIMLYVSLTKIVTRESYVMVIGVLALLFDVFGSTLIMIPYNITTVYVMKSEPIFFGPDFDVKLLLIYAVFVAYSIGIIVLLNYLAKKYKDKIRNLVMRAKIVVWIFFALDLGIGTVGYMIKSLYYDWHIFAYYIASIGLGIVIMYEASLYVRRKTAQEVQRENYALNIENAVMKEYYETLSNQIDKNKKFHHDIDNHMGTLKSMIDDNVSKETVTEYANEIKEEYKEIGTLEYCANPVVNAVIQNKSKQCKQLGIDFDTQIERFDISKFKETDFIALMANVLDNAIEECERIDVKKKVVRLKMGSLEKNLFIKVENSTDKTADMLSNLTTSKNDKESHGVGMKIIKEIVEKYKGEYMVDIQDGMFVTRIEM